MPKGQIVRRVQKIQAFLIVSALPAWFASNNCVCIHLPGSNLSVKQYWSEPVLYMTAVRGVSNESSQTPYIKLYLAHS